MTTASTRNSYERTRRQDHVIDSLMRDLASRDGSVRQRARRKLVILGNAAAPALAKGLEARSSQVRWESAKALLDIADPRAAHALISSLEDDDAGTRWIAAEALIALGLDALVPLLRRLVDQADSLYVCEGAHHVLHELAVGPWRRILYPVLTALEGSAPEDVVPVVAGEALEELKAAGD
jgi:HEAT repeat protein